jgi:hypothetical protein
VDPRIPWAAGGFCGTAADLASWNAALHAREGGTLLNRAVYREMVRPATIRGGRRTRYGLGVSLAELAGRRAVQHSGDITGFTSFTAYLPDDSMHVSVLLNTQGPVRPEAIAARVVQAAFGPVRQAPVPSVMMSTLSALAGRYGSDVRVTVLSPADDAARGAPCLELVRGPLAPAQLHFVGHGAEGWTFTDGRARYSFEPPDGTVSNASPAVWADLGVALVRWERRGGVPAVEPPR